MPEHRLTLELEPGQMKTARAGDQEVLVARVGADYFAVEPTCSHYGAPLVEGALVGERIVCPWHHACFDARSGRQIEPPGRDDLACFPVRKEGNTLVVTLPDEPVSHPAPPMAAVDAGDRRTIAILGGGAAALHAAQELRVCGFTGRIVLVSSVDHVPHDRTMLSKTFLQSDDERDWLPLRDAAFFDQHGIELWLGRRVQRVDATARTLHFDDGNALTADALILATGGVPRVPGIPGLDLPGVFTLRDTPDSDAIRSWAEHSTRAVVVGGGFIGMEAAASLRQKGLDVTVVAREALPFTKVFGEAVARRVLAEHEQRGVRFLGTQTVEAFQGEAAVAGVRLSTGQVLPADLVLVGIGVRPATDGFEGVRLAEDGGVEVDERLRAADGVYAAGDIAAFPLPQTGERVRIEHWRLAAQHGRTAARSALGLDAPYSDAPFFWTMQFDLSLRYVGHAQNWDEILVDGDVEAGPFLVYYLNGGEVSAVCGLQRDTEMAAIQELMRRQAMPPLDDIRAGTVDLLAHARALTSEGRADARPS